MGEEALIAKCKSIKENWNGQYLLYNCHHKNKFNDVQCSHNRIQNGNWFGYSQSKGYKDQLLCNHKSFCPEEQLNFLQHGWYTILAAIESYDQH